MTSGDKLYLAWTGVNANSFSTSPSMNVYVSSWDGKTLTPLGGSAGNTTYFPPFFMYSMLNLGMYNNDPVIAMADPSGDIVVRLWNNNNWNTIGDLKLADISDTVTAISSITTTSNKLYLAYGEKLTTGSTIINVVSYDGSTWQSLAGPATIAPGSFLMSLEMAMMKGNPVIVWMQANDSTGKLTIPVSEWNGTQWVSLSSDMKVYNSPWLMTMGEPSCSITSTPDGIAVTWNEGKPYTDPSMGLLYMPTGIVSTYNGAQWTQLDDEVNSDYSSIATDNRDAEKLHGLYINNKMYVTFIEMDQVFLAYYNGSGFNYIGNSLNVHPWLSAGFMASNPYLAQWNGKLYLSFIESSINQNTMVLTSNPVVRELMP